MDEAIRAAPAQPLRLLDLFSGIGGFSLGLERSGGFETVAFCEIDPYCRAVLRRHWPDVPRYEDVRVLCAERLAADGIGVDAICGGFPCQDISFAGGVLVLTASARAFGPSTPVSFASYDPASSSWRTSQLCLDGGLIAFSETWPRSGTMRSGTAYERETSAPLISETGCGLSPTPEASNTKALAMRSGGRSPRNFLAPLTATPAYRLGMVASPRHSIPTPTATDHIVRNSTSTEALNFETNKTVTLNRWVGMWRSPNTVDAKGGTRNGVGQAQLCHQVRQFPTPTANDRKDAGYQPQPNGARAYTLSGAARASEGKPYDKAVGGQLNPTWVEWLMGFPLGWTALEPSETPSSRKSRKRSVVPSSEP